MQRFSQRTDLLLVVSSLILAIGAGVLIPLATGDRLDLSGSNVQTPSLPTPIASLAATKVRAQLPAATATRFAPRAGEVPPAHTATATDRPSEIVPSLTTLPGATLAPTQVAALSATPALEARSPLRTPTAAATPVPAIEPSPTPTPEQIPSPTQSATIEAAPSATAQPQAAPLLPPALEAPAADAKIGDLMTFAWQPAQPLPAGAAYEVVAWEAGQAPNSARGLAAPTTDSSVQIDLAVPYGLGVFKTTDLFWTVLIVQTSPYERLTLPDGSPARTLR